MNTTKKAWLNLILLLATLGVNFAGAMGYINGLSQKDVSDRYQTLITPAPMTFSIWSVIYLLLLASVIMMIVKREDPYYKKAVELLSRPFWATCVLNMLWISTFSYLKLGISTLFIFAFVFILAHISQELLRWKNSGKWLLPLTFGLYTGWLLIAAVVNLAAFLVQVGWNGLGISAPVWAAIILAASVAIALTVLTQLKNAVFPLPIAWAYFGIHQSLRSPDGWSGAYPTLEMVALAGAAVLAVLSAFTFYKNRFAILPTGKTE